MSKFQELINEDKPILVDFYADWCQPCKTMAPVLDSVAKKVGDKARIIKVNVDKNPGAANHYGVKGVPTFIIFRKGKILWKQAGVVPGHELEKLLETHGK